jgi:hypothetical protein
VNAGSATLIGAVVATTVVAGVAAMLVVSVVVVSVVVVSVAGAALVGTAVVVGAAVVATGSELDGSSLRHAPSSATVATRSATARLRPSSLIRSPFRSAREQRFALGHRIGRSVCEASTWSDAAMPLPIERADADPSDPAPDGRERRWQASATGFSFGGPPSAATPALAAAQHALSLAAIDDNARLAKNYVGVADTLPAEWQDAAAFATYGIAVTPVELTTLVAAIDALVRPYIAATRDDPPATAERVHVTLQAFPRTEPR